MTDTIGRFEIRHELGRGSQSVVYLAWDPQLQREVAIKTMHFSVSDPDLNAALLDEARTVGKLRHPNVVPIHDAGEQWGDIYLVFEYIEGGTLRDALRAKGPLAPARAADMMRQVLDALAQAHALGIIHRDLKPSNILLDGAGVPKVMDFGIAVRISEGDGGSADGGPVGTPAYMAPEYIADRVVSEKMDVFAAGLVLLEMLTGEPFFGGAGAEAAMRRIVTEPVTLPKSAGIDDRLGDIILRACARDPARRFATAGEMRQALQAYLNAGQEAPVADGEAQKQSTLEFLLRRMRHKTDFPALSDSISAINKMTDSDRESINKLSNTILKDYALTNKILRQVNAAHYRSAGGGNISTVSRALVVLGFDTIRNIAITLLLFEHLQDKANARELKEAFLRANLAALLARGTSGHLLPREGEEAFICGLFHGLGQLLAQYYFPEEMEEIRKLTQAKKLPEDQAAARVLGLSLGDLGIGIARTWGFPAAIVNSMRRLPEGPVRKPATRDESLRLMAAFANEFCDMIVAAAPEDRHKVIRAAVERFGASMQMSEKQLHAAVEASSVELAEVAAILHINLKQSPLARQISAFATKAAASAGETSLDEMATLVDTSLADKAWPGAESEDEASADVPEDAQAVLTAGIQDISNTLVDEFQLNDVLRITLETMYRAMGFKHVLLCLRDGRTEEMTGRFGFGPDTNEIARRFRFPLSYTADVFHLATSKAADIIITDIDDERIAARVPAWYRELMPARTFVLFPLNIKGKPVALIYCDKDRAGTIAIPEKELALLKALRNQALLAIKQSIP